jgi:hypothetical protein
MARPLFQLRPKRWRSALTLGASLIFLSLLFLPARDDANLRFFIDWRPTLEPLLLIGALALLALGGRSLSAPLRWCAAFLVFLAALLQFADAAVLGIFDRQLDLYFDLPHVPKLLALFYDAAGPSRGAAALLLAAAGSILLVAVIAGALGAAQRALRPPAHARLYLGAVAAVLLVAAVAPGDAERLFAWRTAPVIARQAVEAYRAYAVTHGYDRRYAAALAKPQPAPGHLPGLAGRDVYLVFFESYGTVVLDDPSYATVVNPALEEFAGTVAAAGYRLVSNRIVSPTFGGGSWLAHGTIDAGLKLDPLLTRVITESKRETLPRYMHAAGYRTIAVMPGLKSYEPEASFWGFDRTYTARDLGYDGPPFGWFNIPDQWTLRRLDETEGAAARPPLFAQIVLVSSHTPFVPVPPYIADWRGDDLYQHVPPAEWERIYAPPDWTHLEAPYLASVVYDLKTLAGWLARLPGRALVIILGDHQPPGFIAGDKQPWTVPIHILSRDGEVLRPFERLGYVAGPLPPSTGDFQGMESFLDNFLAAYATAPAMAKAAGSKDMGPE